MSDLITAIIVGGIVLFAIYQMAPEGSKMKGAIMAIIAAAAAAWDTVAPLFARIADLF